MYNICPSCNDGQYGAGTRQIVSHIRIHASRQ